MGRKPNVTVLSEEEKTALREYEEFDDCNLRLRAGVVTLSSMGKSLKEISMETGLNQKNCGKWLKRYRTSGIAGLKDKHRGGRPPVIDCERKIYLIELSKSNPPIGFKRWSCRNLSQRTGLGSATVNRILRELDSAGNR